MIPLYIIRTYIAKVLLDFDQDEAAKLKNSMTIALSKSMEELGITHLSPYFLWTWSLFLSAFLSVCLSLPLCVFVSLSLSLSLSAILSMCVCPVFPSLGVHKSTYLRVYSSGVNKDLFCGQDIDWTTPVEYLRDITNHYSPIKKLERLLACVNAIYTIIRGTCRNFNTCVMLHDISRNKYHAALNFADIVKVGTWPT